MNPERESQERLALKLAIDFVNQGAPNAHQQKHWMEREYRRLRVLPPGTPYFIDDLGRVIPRKGKSACDISEVLSKAKPMTLVRYQNELRKTFELVISDNSDVPDAMQSRFKRTKRKDNKILFDFGGDVWQRINLYHIHKTESDQRLVTPTIETFTRYIAALTAELPWRTKLALCKYCGRFFIAPKRKGGPRPKTCSSKCTMNSKDPTNRDRQRRLRDRRMELTTDSAAAE